MKSISKETALMWTGMMINFCCACNFSYITPFYPPYAQHRGIEPVWYSLVGGLGDGLYILTLFCNRIYHKVNTKTMISFCLISQVLSVTLFSFTNMISDNTVFIGVCIVLRACIGLSLNNLTLSSFSMIILELKHIKAIVMGNFEMAFALGMICGPSIGGFMFRFVDYTYSILFLAFLNFALFILCKVNFRDLQPKIKLEDTIDVMTLIPKPLMLVNMMEIVFISFIFAFNNSIFSPHLSKTFGLDSFQIGLIYAGAGLCQALAQGATGRLLHLGFKTYKLNIIGSSLLLAGLFMISPNFVLYNQPLLWITIPALMVMMLGLGIKYLSNTFEMIPIITDMGYKEDNIFVYISVYMLIYTSLSIGILSGSVDNGKLLEKFGFSKTCIAMFSLLLSMFIIARIVYFIIHSFYSKTNIKETGERTPLTRSIA